MGYLLKPRNSNVESFSLSIFTWPDILNRTGACYILDYGDNLFKTFEYIYNEDLGSPVTNDGFRVSAFRARALATLFKGFVFVKTAILEDYEKASEIEKRVAKELNMGAIPTREFLQKVQRLADFCESSGGFTIN